MARRDYTVDVVIPCYQEEDALPVTVPIIAACLRDIVADGAFGARHCRMIMVDDGSKDATWSLISGLAETYPEIVGVKLSRNYGHQNAMLAGLSRASADVVITMDADLQDDISTLGRMLRAYEQGSDLVLGVRTSRASDTSFKRGTAKLYYRLLSILGVNVVENHADYRLTSRRALDALLAHGEVNLFLRGVIPTIGFKTATVEYTRHAREFGETKYTLRKMISLGLTGVTSFTVTPLRMIATLGAVTFALSTLASLWVLGVAIFFPELTVPGWTSTVLPVVFLGGLQLLSVGVLGEYVGRIYMEVKRRPRFLIEDTTDAGDDV